MRRVDCAGLIMFDFLANQIKTRCVLTDHMSLPITRSTHTGQGTAVNSLWLFPLAGWILHITQALLQLGALRSATQLSKFFHLTEKRNQVETKFCFIGNVNVNSVVKAEGNYNSIHEIHCINKIILFLYVGYRILLSNVVYFSTSSVITAVSPSPTITAAVSVTLGGLHLPVKRIKYRRCCTYVKLRLGSLAHTACSK